VVAEKDPDRLVERFWGLDVADIAAAREDDERGGKSPREVIGDGEGCPRP